MECEFSLNLEQAPKRLTINVRSFLFVCFMLFPKLFMWILHSIPYCILACFNKICFKLFTSDKTNIPLLFRMDASIAFCLLWEIKAVTVTYAVDRKYCETVVSSQTISAELPESEWLFII